MAHQRYDLTGNKMVLDSAAIGNEYITSGTSRTLTAADYGKTIKFNSLTGSTVTLPATTGNGKGYRFVISVLPTGGSLIVKVANTTDAMQGTVSNEDTTLKSTLTFAAAAGTSDTITLNRTTTGGVTLGEWFEVEDFASAVWQVKGVVTSTTTPATVFSATV